MNNVFGVKLRNKETQKILEYWFSKKELRDDWINRFSAEHYEIVEYMNEQGELSF